MGNIVKISHHTHSIENSFHVYVYVKIGRARKISEKNHLLKNFLLDFALTDLRALYEQK